MRRHVASECCLRQVPPRQVTHRGGLSYNQSRQASLGYSLGRRELQGIPKHVSQCWLQDSSPARTFRNFTKATLTSTVLWSGLRLAMDLPSSSFQSVFKTGWVVFYSTV